MKRKLDDVYGVLQATEDLYGPQTFEGMRIPDKNFENNFVLIESSTRMFSFSVHDVIREEKSVDGRVKVTLRKGCAGLLTTPFKVGLNDVSLLSCRESDPLPVHQGRRKKNEFASARDIARLRKSGIPPKTLAAAAANWVSGCALNDDEANDCAHFLSNAFINAGFTELMKKSSHPSITEWCDFNDKNNGNARPIRAKDMWDWFQKMAERSKRTKPKKEGFWATFQWDPSYSGGHVLLYDSDADKVYGTAVYWGWKDQFFYQW